MPNHDDLIVSAEACQILGGVDRSTLSRWVKFGDITPARQMPGKRGAFLFHRADIEAFAAARVQPEPVDA